MDRINKIFQKNNEKLNKIAKQRTMWLYASSICFVGIISLIFSWDFIDDLHSKSIWWVIVSIMLIVSINWWYWTMKSIRLLLETHSDSIHLLNDIIYELKKVHLDLHKIHKHKSNVDN